MNTRTRQTITLTGPQTAYLKAEAEQLGITVAELVRRIIDRHREAIGPDAVKRREAAE